MGFTTLRYDVQDHVATIAMDRPEARNALSDELLDDLLGAFARARADDDVRVVVLTGAGARAFSVGQDLRERARLNEQGAPPTTFGSRGQPGWPRLTERTTFSKPVVARVNGYALGGGFELVLACDIVVAAEDAVFALPEALLGLVAGAGGVFRLARQLPLKTAMGYLLTGRRMTAQRALELGLVNEVVPAGELDACVDRWVDDLLRCAPLSLRAIKEAVTRSLDVPIEEAFRASYEWEQRRSVSRDAVEGPLAYVQRREPQWLGR